MTLPVPAYSCEGITVYQGDALSIIASLPDGSVDVVITDPPFSEVTHAGARSRTDGANSRTLVSFDSMTPDEFIAFSREALRVARRWVVMFCDWRHAALLEPAGLPLVRLGIWVKPNSAPQLTGDRPATGWEAIAILHPPGKKRWNGGGSRAVWTENRVDATYHPTGKPVPLLAKLVRLFSERGNTVLDPFMGGGSGAIACRKTGRNFIGIEIEPLYVAAAIHRLRQCEQPLFRNIETTSHASPQALPLGGA